MVSLSNNYEPCNIATTQQTDFNGIDVIKFLCSILIFIIHIPPFQGDISVFENILNFGLQNYLCRVAVPFYFMTSGFFLFRNMPFYDLNVERIKNYCYKILRLIGTWNILLFLGGTGHLWYLGATVTAVILLSLCFYFRVEFKYICLLAGLLYLIGLLGDSYHGLGQLFTNIPLIHSLSQGYMYAFGTTRNGVFMGFIFILMGATMSHCKITIKPITAIAGFAVSIICLFVEVCLLKYLQIPAHYNMYVFLIPAVYFLFCFACTVCLRNGYIYGRLRNISMLIYFMHLFVNRVVLLSIHALNNYWGIDLTQFLFVFSLASTLLLAVFIDWLSCKDKFKWLNWLIS